MSHSQNWADTFLVEFDPTRWSAPDGFPASMVPAGMFAQDVPNGLEVVLTSSTGHPSVSDLRRAWEKRRAKRASPVLLVVGYPVGDATKVAVCGPVGEQASVYQELDLGRIERLASLALAEPTHHAATRFLLATLPELDSEMPGLRNVGLLATQELRVGVPGRSDWATACASAVPLLRSRGKDLVEGLGFSVDTLATNTSMLTIGGSRRVVAVFLDEGESFDAPAQRFGTTPVSHALAVADQQNAPWVVLTRGSEIRLYAARPDTGVGRKGRAETFVEANLSLLPEDRAGYLHLLFSASALSSDGTIEEILDRSADFAADLAVRLRERVYFDTVPTLARAVASRMSHDPDESDLAHAYEQVMVILFRLLFLSYAEDKDLLPYRTNSRYADHSLSRMVRRLVDDRRAGKEEYDPQASDLWEDVTQLWRAVDKGRASWGVPAYNGGLFSSDPEVSASGAAIDELELSDAEFGPALAAMLIDDGPEGIGPVDFRSLSVREFGTIYEGLLESQLSVAPSDLTTDAKGNYVPAKGRDVVLVESGAVYFHNQSGARKDTGSYFTKPFAVEHLLDHALEPALDDHLAKLDSARESGDEAGLASSFFDFRCADIAMGSAHFLVAAVDRIEARLSNWLALNPVPSVMAELDRLRVVAYAALGDLGDGVEIETGSLLRRQIARRCVYGVDRNAVAVELARLAIWIHTFVPGLPLSFLDHNLVCGDSLTGVGTLDEVIDALDPQAADGTISVFRQPIEDFLTGASKALARLATVSDADKAEIAEARSAHQQARVAVRPAEALFDLVTANRAGTTSLPVSIDEKAIDTARADVEIDEVVRELRPLHFPTAFPEVFIRDNPGFDCILGNPPWEEATVEELGFWALRFPGLKSMKQKEQTSAINHHRRARPDLVAEYESEVLIAERVRRLLVNGPFPGMDTGDPDLYKAFCWRFWSLSRAGGAIGVVLPRSALSAKGSTAWRVAILEGGAFEDTTVLLNTGGWVFDDAEFRYTIALCAIRKGVSHAGSLRLRGPFSGLKEYQRGRDREPAIFAAAEFAGWTESASFPLIPSAVAVDTFRRMRAFPSIGDTSRHRRVRPTTEFHATSDKGLFSLDLARRPRDSWPVYKGASFNIWEPDTGVYYAWADRKSIVKVLQAKRTKGSRSARSAFSEFAASWVRDESTLPCFAPRLAFRDVTNRTNTRTVIAALVPGEVVITNQAPYLLWPEGSPRDEALLLGILSSMILDWYARRVVELHVNFHLFNSFPVPDVDVNADPMADRVAAIAGRLAAVDERFVGWAAEVGVPVGSVSNDAEKQDLIAELDAAVALLYSLEESDLEVIYSTFHEGKDYSARHAAVLEHYRRLR
jgi:hypothetical protein